MKIMEEKTLIVVNIKVRHDGTQKGRWVNEMNCPFSEWAMLLGKCTKPLMRCNGSLMVEVILFFVIFLI